MIDSRLEAGDIIRTKRGLFATVKADDGRTIAASFPACYNFPGLPLIHLKHSEVEVVRTKKEDFFKRVFGEIRREERRFEVQRERELRKKRIEENVREKVRKKVRKKLVDELEEGELEEFLKYVRRRK